MQTAPVTDTELRSDQQSGEELADTLTAISVVANRRLRIACHDHDKTISLIFHGFEDGVDSFR